MKQPVNARSLCAIASVFALGLGACGDDDDDESASTGTGTQEEQPAPAGKAAQTIPLAETEFRIDPSTVEVDKAGVIEFRVQNAGTVPHALEVEGDDFEEETDEIAPGEAASLKVELAEGTYELYCPIGDHEAQGMTGELIVGGGGTSSGDDSGGDDDAGDDNPSGDDSGGATAPTDDNPSGDDSGGATAPTDDNPGY